MDITSNRSNLVFIMEKNMKIVAVVVVAVIIIAAAVFAIPKNDDKKDGGDSTDTDMYYFFLDGMDANNGWHSAKGENIVSAFESAMKADGVKYTISSSGWVVFEGYEGTYVPGPDGTATGTGLGVYFYGSTDVKTYSSTYFFNGPSLPSVPSNIVYFAFSAYEMDASGTTYDLTPTTTNAAVSAGGPFKDADYKPLGYDTYYFYLDGMESKGWYSASGDDVKSAFETAMDKAGVKYTISNSGWVTFEGYDGTSNVDDDGNYYGKGVSILLYGSTDVKTYSSAYFFAGPSLSKVSSNIVYISFGDYFSDAITWETTYDVNPSVNTEISKTGPFQ